MVYVVCNVGGTEKKVRAGTGAALLGLGLFAPMPRPVKIASAVIGATELLTVLADYCPVNALIGRNSCPTAHRPHD